MVAETEFRCMEYGEEWVCYEYEDLSVECPDCGCTDIDTSRGGIMTRIFKCNKCTWFFEYPARKNCEHCQSTDEVDRITGETLRSVVTKDANPGLA